MVEVTITIPNDKIDEFKLGFLKAYPKKGPVSDLIHLKTFIRAQLIHYYLSGKLQIEQEAIIVDPELVEV